MVGCRRVGSIVGSDRLSTVAGPARSHSVSMSPWQCVRALHLLAQSITAAVSLNRYPGPLINLFVSRNPFSSRTHLSHSLPSRAQVPPLRRRILVIFLFVIVCDDARYFENTSEEFSKWRHLFLIERRFWETSLLLRCEGK